MLLGNDTSSFQGNIDFSVYKNNSNFLIAKSSEGIGFTDKQFYRSQAEARNVGLPFGAYHFARPDLGNDPAKEADWFLKVVGEPREGEFLALDFEVTYHDPVGWCKNFLDRIKFMLQGYKPLIYLDQNRATSFDWTPVVNADYGLWIASYTYDPKDNTANIGKWPFAAMQQWTNKQQVPGILGTVDGDVFFGDLEKLKAYGYKKLVPPPTPPSSENGSTTTPPPQPPSPPAPQPVVDYKPYLERIKKAVNEKDPWWYAFVQDQRIAEVKAILAESDV